MVTIVSRKPIDVCSVSAVPMASRRGALADQRRELRRVGDHREAPHRHQREEPSGVAP